MLNIERLIELNKGLVVYNLVSFGLTNDHDAISYAFDGLHKAIVNYDTNSTACFSTYATVCIKNSIRQAIRNNSEPVILIPLEATIESEINGPANDVETLLIANERFDALSNIINEIICAEAPSARRVLQYWIDSDFTAINQNIADAFNVSQPYVSKVINKFRCKLANKLREVESWKK